MVLLAWTAAPRSAEAAVLTVCAVDCDHTSIQDAIDDAEAGDTIEVAAGTYTEAGILINGKELVLAGAGSDVTIVQAHTCFILDEVCGDHPVDRVMDIQDASVDIVGLTIRHGASPEAGGLDGGVGGGIRATNSTVRVADSVITDNASWALGGGIASIDGDLEIWNTTVSRNLAAAAGGIYSRGVGSELQIVHSLISQNDASEDFIGLGDGFAVGGGIGVDGGTASISGSLITQNRAGAGGGLILTPLLDFTLDGPQPIGGPATATIFNSALVENEAVFGVGGGIILWDSALTVTGSAIVGNVAEGFDDAFFGHAIMMLSGGNLAMDASRNWWGDAPDFDELILHQDGGDFSTGSGLRGFTFHPHLNRLQVVPATLTPTAGETVEITATLSEIGSDDEESVTTVDGRMRFTPGPTTVGFVDGVAVTSMALTGAQTITAAVVFGNGLGEYVSDLTGSASITWASPPAPPEEPLVTPSPTPTSGPTITRTNPVSTSVVPGTPSRVETTSGTGSTTRVTAPPSALPDGATLNAAAIDNIEQLLAQAPPPAGAQITLAFVIEATSQEGDPLTSFETPIEIEFTLPASEIPAGATGSTLVLAFWNGSSWTEVEGVVTQNPDGSYTIAASVDHFTIFSVLHQPHRGTFTVPLRETGVTFTIWGGGNLEALRAALPEGGTAWVWVDGTPFAYRPSLPAFVNARFLAQFPAGIPSNTAVVVAR